MRKLFILTLIATSLAILSSVQASAASYTLKPIPAEESNIFKNRINGLSFSHTITDEKIKNKIDSIKYDLLDIDKNTLQPNRLTNLPPLSDVSIDISVKRGFSHAFIEVTYKGTPPSSSPTINYCSIRQGQCYYQSPFIETETIIADIIFPKSINHDYPHIDCIKNHLTDNQLYDLLYYGRDLYRRTLLDPHWVYNSYRNVYTDKTQLPIFVRYVKSGLDRMMEEERLKARFHRRNAHSTLELHAITNNDKVKEILNICIDNAEQSAKSTLARTNNTTELTLSAPNTGFSQSSSVALLISSLGLTILGATIYRFKK